MYDPLQTELHEQPIEPEPKLSFIQRFQQKLTESRYFMVSMIFHSIVVAFAATYVVIRATEPPEFVAEGGDGLISATDDLTPPPETPSDAVPTEQVAPTAPNINSPTIDVIQTTSTASSFKVAPTQVQVKINTNAADLSKATATSPKESRVASAICPAPCVGAWAAAVQRRWSRIR